MVPLPTIDVLDSIAIPVACPVDWDTMHGDDRVRFCDKCNQNVHDVSELARAEAVQLVTDGESMPCLRVYRRPDGRVMTADCTTRRERVWKWLHKRSAWAAGLFALVFITGCGERRPGCMAGAPLPSDQQIAGEAAMTAVQFTIAILPAVTTGGAKNHADELGR
ncbi:hypothetical protein [Gemmata sp.]|uniref:hypothetical protein n=1 Tax=Gemmata sp. TaxID=1914242 RepID=UPI003F6EDB78